MAGKAGSGLVGLGGGDGGGDGGGGDGGGEGGGDGGGGDGGGGEGGGDGGGGEGGGAGGGEGGGGDGGGAGGGDGGGGEGGGDGGQSSHTHTSASSCPQPLPRATGSSSRVHRRAPCRLHRASASSHVALCRQPPMPSDELPHTPYVLSYAPRSSAHRSVDLRCHGVGGGRGGGDGWWRRRWR